MVLLLPTAALPPTHGIAEYVQESSKAIKDVTEGEFDVTTVTDEGTTGVRFLVSGKESAVRMTVFDGKRPVNEVAVIGNRGVAVDHAAHSVVDFDFTTLQRAAEKAKSKSDAPFITVEPGTLSINLDPREGLIVKSTPELENVRRWTSGDEEMITGDIGKAKGRVGTFQWVRNVKTKMPKCFSSTVKGRTTEVLFAVVERKVSLKEIEIPLDTLRGYTRGPLPASGTL